MSVYPAIIRFLNRNKGSKNSPLNFQLLKNGRQYQQEVLLEVFRYFKINKNPRALPYLMEYIKAGTFLSQDALSTCHSIGGQCGHERDIYYRRTCRDMKINDN